MIPAADVADAAGLVLSRPARLGRVRLVAVDGPSGSGKTTLAALLARAVADRGGGTVLDLRPPDLRPPDLQLPDPTEAPQGRRSDEPDRPRVAVLTTDLLATWEEPLDWWSRLEKQVLQPLSVGLDGLLQVTEWVSGTPRPGRWQPVPAVDVLILEGVSAGRAAAADRLTALIWVEVPSPAERLERAVARDGEGMRPFLVRWQVQEAEHFAADRTAERADLVLRPGRR